MVIRNSVIVAYNKPYNDLYKNGDFEKNNRGHPPICGRKQKNNPYTIKKPDTYLKDPIRARQSKEAPANPQIPTQHDMSKTTQMKYIRQNYD